MSTHAVFQRLLIYPSGSHLWCNVLQGFLSRTVVRVQGQLTSTTRGTILSLLRDRFVFIHLNFLCMEE